MGREEASFGREDACSAPEAAALLGNVMTPDRLGVAPSKIVEGVLDTELESP